MYVLLGLRVINLRRTGQGPALGQTGDERFTRAVRAHANFGEYAPIFLILLGLYEYHGGIVWVLFTSAIIFLIGRLMHAIGLGVLGKGPWRTLGMVCTNAVLLTLAFLIIFQTIYYW